MDNVSAIKDSLGPKIAGPRVLSLHPTSTCAINCAPCYLKRNRYGEEKPLSYFAAIVKEAVQSESIREVALAVNIDPPGVTKNRDVLNTVSEAVRNTQISLTVTTNYENLKAWGAAAFTDCHLVSVSIDEYKFPSLELPGDFFDQITKLQSEGVVANLNVLLSKRLLKYLTLGRLRRWLGIADQVYLVVPKHYPLDFTRNDLLKLFDRIAPVWENPDRFFRLQIDNCIRPEVFPWNQLTPNCEWGENLVNILPDGGLTLCPMDKPQVHLESSNEFLPAINRYYIAERRKTRSRCPFIDFQDNGSD